MNWILNEFETDELLVRDLAPRIARVLQVAIAQRERATLAVSGGSTPKRLFETLSREEVEWPKVTVILVDERWVDDTDPDSNAGLVRNHLLQNRAADARFIGMKTPDADPFQACPVIDERYRDAWPLDIAILGLGQDGHTASFHPESEGLGAALTQEDSLVYGVVPAAAPHQRMTLSLTALQSAGLRVLHVVGEKKFAVLKEAMQDGPVEEMPVRSVLLDPRHPIDIYYAKSGGDQ